MGSSRRKDNLFAFLAKMSHTLSRDSNLAMAQSHSCFPNALGYQLPISSYLMHFVFAARMPFDHIVSLSVDNYLAMEVACTLVCPRANQEVITTHPDGNETQKCEKCEGDCPKGGDLCVPVCIFSFGHNTLLPYAQWPL